MTTATKKTRRRRPAGTISKNEVAVLMGVSPATVYASLRRYTAAKRAGDVLAMRQEIPCHHMGGVEQEDGTFKHGRYVIQRDEFDAWFAPAATPSNDDLKAAAEATFRDEVRKEAVELAAAALALARRIEGGEAA